MKQNRLLNRAQHLLIEPPASLQDVAIRRNSRLLAIFLLVMIVVFAIVDITYLLTVPGYQPPWYGYLFLFTAYGLNRSGRYLPAAVLTIAMFPLVVFGTVLSGNVADPTTTLSYLLLSLIASAILFPRIGVVILAAVEVIGILLMPILAPQVIPGFESIVGPLSLVMIGAALALVFMRQRDLIEQDRQAELRASQEQLRFALDSARMGTWNWNILTNEVQWSELVEPIFGLYEGEFAGTYEAYLALVPPADREKVIQTIQAVLQGSTADNYVVEHRLYLPDGTIRWIEGRGQLYRDKQGNPVHMAGTVADISERKQAEEQLKIYAAELERSNRELDSFASIASHDMQEPLRKMSTFSDRLLMVYGRQLDERGQQYIERIQDAALRMQLLIQDLLAFSRVNASTEPFVPVDLNEVAQEVLGDLEVAIRETGGQVIIGQLPQIEAEGTQMRQLLLNLIGNALKYHQPDIPPQVEVNGERFQNNGRPWTRLTIRDNGIGFDEQYLERIFEVFQRLHGRSEYEGTGVGLAICKRIVERHGGHITARSTPGEGATFLVTLPERQ
jgi:PAS domain S-box-containing protein